MTDYKQGIDVSRHQGEMDWAKAVAAGVEFAAIRCTVGNYYQDPRFSENWTNALAAGVKFLTAYHVVKPSNSISSQMSNFFNTFGNRINTLPIVLDCELHDNLDAWANTASVEGCAKLLLSYNTFAYPFIYTNWNYWTNHIRRSAKWISYPLWVANYTSAAAPLMPTDWDEFAIWQWSADNPPNYMGSTYGAQSTNIDLDRGNPEWLVWQTPEPAPEPLTLEERVAYLESLHGIVR